MSYKRKHAEDLEGESSTSKPFKKQRPFNAQNGARNHNGSRHHKRPQVSSDISTTTSTNALKSRIRDLKRLLAHVENVEGHKMSAGMRVERERELEACEHELKEKVEQTREAEYRTKIIGKYHQVRFFDRQKATRILKKLKKELASENDAAAKEELEQKIHNAEVDVNYASFYPLLKPYSSLYPKSKNGGSEGVDQEDTKEKNKDQDGPKGDKEMWATVERAMAEGTLNSLRNSKEALPVAPVQKAKKKQFKNQEVKPTKRIPEQKNRRERRAYEAEHAEDDSDGGFFE